MMNAESGHPESPLKNCCPSVINLITMMAAAVLENNQWRRFLEDGDVAPLRSRLGGILGAERVPYCPENCSEVENCRVRISNNNVSTVADSAW